MLNSLPLFFGLSFKNDEWSCSVGGVFYNVLCPNDRVPLLLVADLKIFKQFCPQSQGVLGLAQVLNHKGFRTALF